MASGNTTTSALADSLDSVTNAARIIREFEGVMPQLVEKQTLGEGEGLNWKEVSFAALTAQAVAENQELNNPQQMSDTPLTITPTVVGVHTVITDRVARTLNRKAYGKLGQLAQNAIQRKKDEDGLVVLDSGTSLAGAGTTLVSGHVSAAVTRIQGNATEAGKAPYRCVLHPYQNKDIEDELKAPLGTYSVDGLSARVFSEGFKGMIGQAQVYLDGNITIDSSDDAKGGVFPQEGILLVQGRSPWTKPVRNEKLGGGATEVLHYDEYAYGIRYSGWIFELLSDATTPTS